MNRHGPHVFVAIFAAQFGVWESILTDGVMRTWATEERRSDWLARGHELLVVVGEPPNKAASLVDRWFHSRAVRFNEDRIQLMLASAHPRPRFKVGQPPYSARYLRMLGPDTYFNTFHKHNAVLELFLASSCDFLYLPMSTSYVVLPLLERRAASLLRSSVYAGPVSRNGGQEFVSGRSRLISRDVAELLYAHRQTRGRRLFQDVEFGRQLSKFGIPITVHSSPFPEEYLSWPTNLFELDQAPYHYRTKWLENGLRKDVALMQFLDRETARQWGV